MSRRRVVLLFGGRSGEHEVSCVSARHIAAAMDPLRYEVIPLAIGLDGRWMLPDVSRKVLEGGPLEIPDTAFEASGEPVALVQSGGEIVPLDHTGSAPAVGAVDVVFPVLHGPNGEDGTVQGLLEIAGLPYVGSGVLGSALGMDKEKMKVVFHAEGLPTARFLCVRADEWAEERDRIAERAAARIGFPCFTKPANLGSSVGIRRCRDPGALAAGIDEALRHDRKALVEESVPGRELECGVLGGDRPDASVVGEVVPGREFYDYAAKYLEESSRTIVPADLPPDVAETVQRYSVRAFRAIDAAGMARVDFFYDEGGRGVVVNEINTIPGFTTISMFPKLWEASGIGYAELIDRLIAIALERHRSKPRPEDLPRPD